MSSFLYSSSISYFFVGFPVHKRGIVHYERTWALHSLGRSISDSGSVETPPSLQPGFLQGSPSYSYDTFHGISYRELSGLYRDTSHIENKTLRCLPPKACICIPYEYIFPLWEHIRDSRFMKSFFIQASLVELIVTQRLQFMPHGAISSSFIFLHSFKKVDHCKAPASLSSVIIIL